MDDRELKKRIASFPRWHYQFDLRGQLTPIWSAENVNRHAQRKRYFMDPLVEFCGGSLEGKRVLDLGCNAGFWSLAAAEAGCEQVVGVDGRQMHIDQANLVFEAKGIDRSRYEFQQGDLFRTDLAGFGEFDIVLCLGLLYHVSKPMELMERISPINRDLLVIDTDVSWLPGSAFEVHHDRLEQARDAVDYSLVFHPTRQAVADLTEQFGYRTIVLRPQFTSYEGAYSFRVGRRWAFICAKQADLSQFPAEQAALDEPVGEAGGCWLSRVGRRLGVGRKG